MFTGLVFSLGLNLVVLGGADLLTGNMARIPLAVFDRKVTRREDVADKTGVIEQGAGGTPGASWTPPDRLPT